MSKKIKVVEPEVKKIYLQKDSYGEQTRNPYVNDEGETDQWYRGDTSTSWIFGEVSLTSRNKYEEESYPPDFDVKAGDTIFLVIAVWSDGDSFGHDSGARSEIFGVYKTFTEARERESELENGSAKDPYLPWNGYFESLDYVTVETRMVMS